MFPSKDYKYMKMKPFISKAIQNLIKFKKSTKGIYSVLNQNDSKPTSQEHWFKIFKYKLQWKQIHSLLYENVKDNLRILHNILATNFIQNHLFWKCEIKDMLEKTDAQYRPEEMSFILGNLENRNHYLFILEIKSFIYWCRRTNKIYL